MIEVNLLPGADRSKRRYTRAYTRRRGVVNYTRRLLRTPVLGLGVYDLPLVLTFAVAIAFVVYVALTVSTRAVEDERLREQERLGQICATAYALAHTPSDSLRALDLCTRLREGLQ